MSQSFAPLELMIHEALATAKMAGIAIGIVQENAIAYSKGFGVRSIATGELVTAESLFHMASVSKPFSATAIMQLVEQGKLTLDDRVCDHLPYFQLADERHHAITIRQMLTHTSGMPDTEDYAWDKPETDEEALERYVRSLAHEQLLSTPGEAFAYSNIAYEVLGDLIAKVSEMSFEQYMKSQILDPLGMHHSTFLRSEVPAHLATTPHVGTERAEVSAVYPYNRCHAPSSTLHSNTVDGCRWALANLNEGQLEGASILSSASAESLFGRYHATGEGDFIGLSWFHADYRGYPRISHGGGDTGYASYLALFPREKAAVVVMANSDWELYDIGPIIDKAMDLALGIDDK
ncbi:MAG TPA: serine hydrolase domain-containing protein [Caldilineaceae bacterium]|nr:serine hydrolase domain-containing protein [Caldilineaceae bacterium]